MKVESNGKLLELELPKYLYVYKHETNGLMLGFEPHPAQNMWKTEIVGKIKLEKA